MVKLMARLIHFLFNTDYFINGYIMLLGLVHPFLTARSLEIFSCASDGSVHYMMYNQIEECYTSSWYTKMPIAVLGIIFYGIGIPLVFLVIVYRHRNNLDNPVVISRYGSVYFCYSHARWYWESVVKLR